MSQESAIDDEPAKENADCIDDKEHRPSSGKTPEPTRVLPDRKAHTESRTRSHGEGQKHAKLRLSLGERDCFHGVSVRSPNAPKLSGGRRPSAAARC